MSAYGPTYCQECKGGKTFVESVKREERKGLKSKKLRNVSVSDGDGVVYWDGAQEKHISNGLLRHIKSNVTTHEGETLRGKKGRDYMDKHSKKNLGKDLAGSYKDSKLAGYV